MYAWEYLKNNKTRGKYLFNILQPHLKTGDTFLDVDCGYSPLAQHILTAGYKITGFDIHPEPIRHLQETLPVGNWQVHADNLAEYEGYTVFLLLGVTTPLRSIYSSTYIKSLQNLINRNHPRIVLIETANVADQRLYFETCNLFLKCGYIKIDGKSYDAQLDKASRRHYSLWLKT